MTAPGRATATVWPAATFGAPQTICDGVAPPMSTMQTLSRSASGCCSALEHVPDDEVLERADAVVLDALDLGAGHRQALGERVGVEVAARSTRAAIRAGRASAHELLQEADVVVVEQPQVGDAVLEHRDPLDPHPEREPLHALGVVAVLARRARTRSGRPSRRRGSRSSAVPLHSGQRCPSAVTPAGAVEAGDVDLDARLGEREEVRPQADLALVAEDRARERQQRPLEVGQRDVVVDREPLDLVELRRVRGVGVGPVDAPRER